MASGAVVVALIAACSTHAKLAGQGEQCFQATDCEDGLVCVPAPDGRSACTNDVSSIVHMQEAGGPAEAAPRDGATDAPPSDAPMMMPDAPPAEAAPQDSAPAPDATD
jgi:hypothetical protein